MAVESIDFLRGLSARRVRQVPRTFKRYLYEQIDWSDRLIMIKGARGTGKTTLMLQRLREAMADPVKALYVSLDHLWFSENSLYDVADYHWQHGGTHLFIDEIHYHPRWQQLLKNLYDDFADLSIVYTGSSLLKLETSGADLSRRQMTYTLPGLSFREFLAIEDAARVEPVSLERLLEAHGELACSINEQISVLPLFNAYLTHGYYPFYKEVRSGYLDRLDEVIGQVLDADYPAIEDVTIATTRKARKMLAILARSVPQTPNMAQLYRELETDRNHGLKMLAALERAQLVRLLPAKGATLKNMSKPEKVYCGDTNIMAALVPSPDIGSMRETFFMNALVSAGHELAYPSAGDFLVDGRHLFEVGGKSKTFAQIHDLPHSYLAVDGIDVGYGNRIPLWMFGLLY